MTDIVLLFWCADGLNERSDDESKGSLAPITFSSATVVDDRPMRVLSQISSRPFKKRLDVSTANHCQMPSLSQAKLLRRRTRRISRKTRWPSRVSLYFTGNESEFHVRPHFPDGRRRLSVRQLTTLPGPTALRHTVPSQ